jgi:hypothetical protein
MRSLITSALHQTFKVKEGEMGNACITHERFEKYTILIGKPEVKRVRG